MEGTAPPTDDFLARIRGPLAPGARRFGLLLLGLAVLASPPVLAWLKPGDWLKTALPWYLWATDVLLASLAGVLWMPREIWQRLCLWTASLTAWLLGLEAACLVGWFGILGTWVCLEVPERPMFQAHPYLVAVPAPDLRETRQRITIVHNAAGFRGAEVTRAKPTGVRRVVVIGGSTTYCIGVTQGKTWPEILEQLLGSGTQVLNFGVPGYGSVEHVIQTAFRISDWQPDLVVFYLGWNDIRNVGIRDLAPDYADFHGPSQYGNLALPRVWTGPPFALARTAVTGLYQAGWLLETPDQSLTPVEATGPERLERPLRLYERNLRHLVALCRSQGWETVFVPQILDFRRLTGREKYGWLPFVEDREIEAVMSEYNRSLARVASETGVRCVGEVVAETWEPRDFLLGNSHFSEAGCAHFARVLAPVIRDALPVALPGPPSP